MRCSGKTRPSINFVVRADAFEQNGVLTFVLHELKDDPQIVASAAGPRTCEFALQLVRLELGMKRVLGQQFERQLKFRCDLRMFAGKPGGRSE